MPVDTVTPTATSSPASTNATASKWYKLQGSDGKWYKTQAASPETAKAKLSSHLVKQPSTQPPTTQAAKPDPIGAGAQLRNLAKGVVEGVKGATAGTYHAMADPPQNDFERKIGPTGRLIERGVIQPTLAAAQWYHDAFTGKIPDAYEHALSVGSEALGQGLGAVLTGKASAVGVEKMGLTPETNIKAIKTLNDKALKMNNDAGAVRMARENIKGNIEQVQQQLDAKIKSYEQPKLAALDAATKGGAKLPSTMGPEIRQIVDDMITVTRRKGTQSGELGNLVAKLRTKVDPKTGQAMIRDWTNLTVQEAYDLTSHDGLLSREAAFEKGSAATAKNIAAKRIGGIVSRYLGETVPEVAKYRKMQSELIPARDAAFERLDSMKKGNAAMFKGIMNSGAPLLGLYVIAKALGVSSGLALGGLFVLKSLMETTSSRTARAALRAKFLALEDQVAGKSFGKPGVSPSAGQPGGAPLPAGQPSPQGGVARLPATGQAAPQGGAPQGPSALPAGVQRPVAQNTTTGNTSSPMADTLSVLQKIREASNQRAAASQPSVTASPAVQPQPKALPASTGPTVQRVDAGVSGVGAKTKTMLDRLDVLFERKANPKSGHEAASIDREIEQIKKQLDKSTPVEDAAKLRKKMLTRERVTSYRDRQMATTSLDELAGTAASRFTPEQQAIVLEQGYNKLGELPDGKEYVKSLKKMSKELKWDGVEEITHLTEALKTLQQIQ